MQLVEYKLSPDFIQDENKHRQAIAKIISCPPDQFSYKIIRKNIDARKSVVFVLKAEVYFNQEKANSRTKLNIDWKTIDVSSAEEIHIIGSGPCGYFAALECIKLGLKPIVIERGKDVQERRRDLRAIQQDSIINPDSNYCFGEGGAGTYSDGKLYTRSNKRGNINDVLHILIQHGADEEILIDVHPHIGSNKLPKIVAAIRDTILNAGGEIHFNHCVTDLIIQNNKIKEIICGLTSFECSYVILATGHSARDIYRLLFSKNIHIEYKDFALGLRIEHPQLLIDQMQYHQVKRHENLPASSYSLSCQINHKGVFSFCMCPGGLIVPAATAPGEIVVNGMSLSRRDSPYANSGFVTSVDHEDFKPFQQQGALQAMAFQAEVEKRMFDFGDGSQKAPAQRVIDFLEKRIGSDLPDSSYIPGIYSAPLHELLPKQIADRLINGLRFFGKKMKSYLSEEAVLHGTESRTSAPVKIPRDPITCCHPQIINLLPAGEGAGFAGGILSAAMDGQRVVQALHVYNKRNGD